MRTHARTPMRAHVPQHTHLPHWWRDCGEHGIQLLPCYEAIPINIMRAEARVQEPLRELGQLIHLHTST